MLNLKKLKLPLMLIGILSIPLLFGSFISLDIKSVSYALSLSMKSILEFVLPFIIFSFVFSCLSNLKQGAMFFVLLLIVCVFCSNFSALMLGYISAKTALYLHPFTATAAHNSYHLIPAWSLHIKKIINNETALILGFISGIFFSLYPHPKAKMLAAKLNTGANLFLKKAFIPLLPLFVLGFVFKLEHEQILKQSLTVYGPVLLLIVLTQWLYLLSWYLIAANGSIAKFATYLRNVLPATLTGFTTISSAASMPVLLVSTEKNLGDAEKADILVPTIINIHTIGSAIAMPILALATMLTFNLPIPTLSTFVTFAFFTALAKFAVAAVPGGVVIVVAPLLQNYLGFSGDMIGLITAIYLILDPFGTGANVTGNGVFPIVFTKLYEKLESLKGEASASEKLEA